jgi:hypothetical protein
VITFPIRTWSKLALCLMGLPVCAQAPQARVNPIPAKLPIHYSNDIRFTLISTEDGHRKLSQHIVQDDLGFMVRY